MKNRKALHEIFFNLRYKCAEVFITPISKSTSPFSAAPSFSNKISTFRSGSKKNVKRTYYVDYHPSSSELTSRIHTPKGFISPGYPLIFFLKPTYPTMVGKKIQIYGVNITWKYICESKDWIFSFSLTPPSKTLPQVFIITPSQAEGNYPFSPISVFWKSIFAQQKNGELWSWKNDQN